MTMSKAQLRNYMTDIETTCKRHMTEMLEQTGGETGRGFTNKRERLIWGTLVEIRQLAETAKLDVNWYHDS